MKLALLLGLIGLPLAGAASQGSWHYRMDYQRVSIGGLSDTVTSTALVTISQHDSLGGRVYAVVIDSFLASDEAMLRKFEMPPPPPGTKFDLYLRGSEASVVLPPPVFEDIIVFEIAHRFLGLINPILPVKVGEVRRDSTVKEVSNTLTGMSNIVRTAKVVEDRTVSVDSLERRTRIDATTIREDIGGLSVSSVEGVEQRRLSANGPPKSLSIRTTTTGVSMPRIVKASHSWAVETITIVRIDGGSRD